MRAGDPRTTAIRTSRWCWVISLPLFALFVAYFGLHCFRYPWSGDIDRHVASVASFYRSLSSPPHEAIALPEGDSEVHTPYILAVAIAGRSLGITPFRALQLAGVANLVLYVLAIVLFFRTFSSTAAWPLGPLAFLVVSLFVRDELFHWSSETSFVAVRLTQAYPSFFAWGLALVLFSVGERYLRSNQSILLIVVLLAAPFLLISHPLTGSWAILMLVVLGAVSLATLGAHANGTEVPRWSLVPRVLTLFAVVAVSIGLATRWPYFELLRPGGLLGTVEESTFADHPFYDFRSVYVPALISSFLFLRHRMNLFLLAGFVSTCAALAAFRTAGWDYGNRYAFFMAFFAQVAVAESVALVGAYLLRGRASGRAILSSWPSRALLVASVGAATILALSSNGIRRAAREGEPLLGFGELLQRQPTHAAYYARMGFLLNYLDESDVVLMPVEHAAWDLSSLTGARVIAAPFSFRVPDFEQRVRDVNRFFAPTATPEERNAIVARYGVTAVLLVPSMQGLHPLLEESLGRAISFPEGYVLFYTREGSRRHARRATGT